MSTRTLLPLLLAIAAGACDNLGISGEPEELNLDVKAIGTSRVVLVTSTNWVLTRDPACEPTDPACPEVLRIFLADTVSVDVPLKRTLRFTNSFKYLVEVFPPDGTTATVSMRADIDGRVWYDEARELRSAGQGEERESLQFVYQWREPTIR